VVSCNGTVGVTVGARVGVIDGVISGSGVGVTVGSVMSVGMTIGVSGEAGAQAVRKAVVKSREAIIARITKSPYHLITRHIQKTTERLLYFRSTIDCKLTLNVLLNRD